MDNCENFYIATETNLFIQLPIKQRILNNPAAQH